MTHALSAFGPRQGIAFVGDVFPSFAPLRNAMRQWLGHRSNRQMARLICCTHFMECTAIGSAVKLIVGVISAQFNRRGNISCNRKPGNAGQQQSLWALPSNQPSPSQKIIGSVGNNPRSKEKRRHSSDQHGRSREKSGGPLFANTNISAIR